MRWLVVSARHHPGQGGIGTYVAHFCAAAHHARWHVELVTRPGPYHPPVSRVHEIRTPDHDLTFRRRIPVLRRIDRIRPYRYGLFSLAVAERLLHVNTSPDVIEFVDCQAEGYVALCSRRVRARFRGVPMIVHAHTPMFLEEKFNGCDPGRFGRSIYHGWEHAALRAADGIVVGSRLLADRLGIEATVIAPCLPPEYADSTGTTATDRRWILCVGSIQPRKGVDVWARSLNTVLRRCPRASATLIGPNTMTAPDGSSMVKHVRKLIDRDLRHRFHWRGALTHKQTLRAIATAALVVAPSRFESLSYVGIEAILRARPLVFTDQVGLAEWVRGSTRVPAGDADALAEAQFRVLDNLSSAENAAWRWRAGLLAAAPHRLHLAEKRALAGALAGTSSHPKPAMEHQDDAIERMRRFLASVEEAEAAAGEPTRSGERSWINGLRGDAERCEKRGYVPGSVS